MSKLLANLKSDPTNPAKVHAVRVYVAKHPMALCLVSEDDMVLLALHGIK